MFVAEAERSVATIVVVEHNGTTEDDTSGLEEPSGDIEKALREWDNFSFRSYAGVDVSSGG